ncbi:hypothetical protein QE377_002964 [Microbacterium sp. SORGH_AS 862]|nr:hypothetical protein [Microbacterium sp. SORGH_AS_0862]
MQHVNRILPQLAFNPIRHPDACVVCTGSRDLPANPVCNSCRELRGVAGEWRVANLVVPLSYACEVNAQFRQDIRNYKDGWPKDVQAEPLYRLSALTWHFFYRHVQCVEAVGGPVDHIVLVPSGIPGSRPDGHPLAALARFAPRHWNELRIERTANARERVIDTGSLELRPPVDLTGRHVVVFDDTFTTGAKSQSVAAVVRDAGARFVTILVVARVLNLGWAPTAELLQKHPRQPWDGERCPVTGGACP